MLTSPFVVLTVADLMAHSHCTEPGMGLGPGTGRMGTYILCCTVHTAAGMGTGPENATMGCGPIFPYLICTPEVRCNQFQLLFLYIMPFLHHSNNGAKMQNCFKMYKTSKTTENFKCVHNIFAVASTAGVQGHLGPSFE